MSNKTIKKLEDGLDNYYGKSASKYSGSYGADSYTSYAKDELEDEPHDPKNPKKGCTEKHPPLSFEIEDKVGTIYGSACASPIVEADLFISLDERAPVFDWEQPWMENEHNQKHIRYFIKDFSVPDDAEDFDACVDIAIATMAEGKTVHVGCLSGHGRTGMFLSALTHKLIGEQLKEDNISAIDYVRDNYCAKVVETLEQVLFLHANYDIDIPIKEKADVDFIKKEFKKQIGVSLDKVIELGEYNACTEVINDLEAMVLSRKPVPAMPSMYKPAPLYTQSPFEAQEDIPSFDKPKANKPKK